MEKVKEQKNIRTGRHCVFLLHVHLVFVTKYRTNIFQEEHLNYLKNIFSRICNGFEANLKEFDGTYDHVHLLVNYPPKVSVSKLVNALNTDFHTVFYRHTEPEFRGLSANITIFR